MCFPFPYYRALISLMSVLTKNFYTEPWFKSYGTVSLKVGQKVDLARGKKGKMGILDCIMIL